MTFYRVHWATNTEFSAANAWSSTTGRERSEDGTRVECLCDGNPDDWEEREDGTVVEIPCRVCDGTGWEDCDRGYSCFATARQLIRYMAEHVGPIADDHGSVIIFEGERTDEDGFDGEPLVVPTEILETLTWSQFVAREAATA